MFDKICEIKYFIFLLFCYQILFTSLGLGLFEPSNVQKLYSEKKKERKNTL